MPLLVQGTEFSGYDVSIFTFTLFHQTFILSTPVCLDQSTVFTSQLKYSIDQYFTFFSHVLQSCMWMESVIFIFQCCVCTCCEFCVNRCSEHPNNLTLLNVGWFCFFFRFNISIFLKRSLLPFPAHSNVENNWSVFWRQSPQTL